MTRNTIIGVFAKSPIKPLEKHIRLVAECSKQLIPFFNACTTSDWESATTIRKKISTHEKEADALKRKLRLELPGGLFMPVERTDLLELLSEQDKIANKSKDIAGRVLGRKIIIPDSLQAPFLAYLERNLDAIQKAADAINELDDLLETGFRGIEVELVEKMINELDLIENDTDSMQIKIRQDLLEIENGLNPVDVIFLYQIIDWVGELADIAERVGARLEIMLARK